MWELLQLLPLTPSMKSWCESMWVSSRRPEPRPLFVIISFSTRLAPRAQTLPCGSGLHSGRVSTRLFVLWKKQVYSNLGPQGAIWVKPFSCLDQTWRFGAVGEALMKWKDGTRNGSRDTIKRSPNADSCHSDDPSAPGCTRHELDQKTFGCQQRHRWARPRMCSKLALCILRASFTCML